MTVLGSLSWSLGHRMIVKKHTVESGRSRQEEGAMDRLNRDDISQLIESRGSPAISIFMPAYRAGTDTLQNPIRFKNQLSRAEKRLSEMGLRAAEITSLLQPLRELVDNYDFLAAPK